MPSQTYQRSSVANTDILLFGYGEGRTSWTIYNIDGANPVYWSNTRMSGTSSGFRIPAGGSFTLKIPEDDPRKEVHIYASNVVVMYVYEGFGEIKNA